MHIKGHTHLRPFVRSLLKAFDNGDPPKNQQRAITPKLLRGMHALSGAHNKTTSNTAFAIVAELSIVAFFFAMRSCEISLTPSPGKTRPIRLGGVVFRDASHREICHRDGDLSKAERVTITFEDQKNGTKMDKRTHQRTNDPVLCPVRCASALVKRIYDRVPNASEDTTLDTMYLVERRCRVSGALIRQHLRSSCTALGGKETFGYSTGDIGTRSLRSGAAMSLFLMNHSVHKIMILGRWSSDAFLVYIRPQVLEWTNNMSQDMIHLDSFFDATDPRKTAKADPRTRQRPSSTARSTRPLRMQPMHLHH